ncbi:protein-L-isoaspartate O-methyltransferase family protein [Microvirga antarctica]|uniref:protein-L-isoaspartate O-methyltransferase family protein n=1 Tax=Microvirga antarctica TaxID=2819233 RepID=UPI001B30B7B3|nr:methyltransferase domain-containing protein [Microvirga antarctica]
MLDDGKFDEDELRIVRRAFARQMLAVGGIVHDPGLEDAFASVPREMFVGEAPWQFISRLGYQELASRDPAAVYQDINIGLRADRGVNNGSPSLHARWLHAAGVQRGDRVAHIGAGTGYYTAILAHLVGDAGHVLAVECDADLAHRARRNLATARNVTLVEGDGAVWPREPVDVVYVNFAAMAPAECWIETLKSGGRLIFPLGVPRPNRTPTGGSHTLYGAGLRISREDNGYAAGWLGPASFVCAEGSLAERSAATALTAAFQKGGIEFVGSLIWKTPAPVGRCWYVGPDWALSYDAAPSANPSGPPIRS